MAHTKAIGRPAIAGMLSRRRGSRQQPSVVATWLTGAMVTYYAGAWTVDELAAIERELTRQGVRYSIDGDDLLVPDPHVERMVDMIVESITET
jgi:hypothetical protein